MSDNPDSPTAAYPPLEEKCKVCGGKGYEFGDKCYGCDGTGQKLTEFGEEVLAMVRRHLRFKSE
jgi:DnaJ-class molecular chaperone